MNANRIVLAFSTILVLSLGLLAACCPTTSEIPGVSEPTMVLQEEPTAEPIEEESPPTEIPMGVPEPTAVMSPLESPLESPIEPPAPVDGQVLLQERCATCHDLVRVTGAKKDRAGWAQSVDRMISKGAQLSDEERVILIDYLAEMYGP